MRKLCHVADKFEKILKAQIEEPKHSGLNETLEHIAHYAKEIQDSSNKDKLTELFKAKLDIALSLVRDVNNHLAG